MYIKNQFLRLRMMIMKKCLGESRYVLVTLSGGLIDQVKFYDDAYMALMNLADYVKSMDPEDSDAVIYGPDGMVANAKLFMDNSEDGADNGRQTGNEKGGIFIVANPCHSLGFLVIGDSEPIGYADPLKALSVLEKLRKEHGVHIGLYKAVGVDGPVMDRDKLERYNEDHGMTDFEYGLIGAFLK